MRKFLVGILVLMLTAESSFAGGMTLETIKVSDKNGAPLQGLVLTSQSGAFDGVSGKNGVVYRRARAQENQQQPDESPEALAKTEPPSQ